VVSFPLVFPPIIYTHSCCPHSCYMARPSNPPWLDYSNYTWWRLQITKLLIMQFSSFSRHLIPLRSKYSPQRSNIGKSYKWTIMQYNDPFMCIILTNTDSGYIKCAYLMILELCAVLMFLVVNRYTCASCRLCRHILLSAVKNLTWLVLIVVRCCFTFCSTLTSQKLHFS
jgi:hypothetical protein